MQSTARFDNVYVSPRVRVALHSILDTNHAKKFWDLINKLQSGDFNTPGMRIERLRTSKGKVYSARLNIEMRVIFSMYTNKENSQRSLVVWDANHHDDAYDRIERTVVPTVFQPSENFLEPEQIWSESEQNLDAIQDEKPDSDEITSGMLLFRVPFYVLSEPDRYHTFERNIDRYLRLSEQQEDLLQRTDRAYLVRGSAGTGKTSLALFYALNIYEQFPEDDIYFFTYQDELACVCRCYKTNLVEEEHAAEPTGDFEVFSYIEFCRHYLRQHLDSSKVTWQWIDRVTSIKYLREIIGSRSRWARTLRPENLYSYIYSILKGRFVPGTQNLPQSPEDFRRIFKGYGNAPPNLEDILEVFGHYEERLSRLKQKDEADLIRYCYRTLKDRALMSEQGRSTWIIIDEMQDFTELEWKSILLFWENQCLHSKGRTSYPFLCGDRNQNISRSGFRWQDVDSYVESILREIHRPKAVEKVQLHHNFRNTKQIFELGVFLRSSATEAGADLGLPPDLTGNKPQIIVGEPEEFLHFLTLLNDPYDSALPAPMVVLFEDNDALDEARRNIANDDGLFFMPLQISKGLEFEDLIVYRLFSSLHFFEPEELNSESGNRLFDLWYMAITRARQNLLIYMTPDDLQKLKETLGAKFNDLTQLVDIHTADVQSNLLRFYHQRERYLPNYAIIFLERTKAAETWQLFKKVVESDGAESPKAQELKDKSLGLWKRCRDIASLGRAYAETGDYEEAIPYLRQASLFTDVGRCYAKLGKFQPAAQNFERAGDLIEAAACYEQCKLFKQAADIYERHQKWLQAATNYYLSGDNLKAAHCFEEARMWQSAAELYQSRSQWLKAAELFQRCESFEQAADMYLKVKDKLDAARCYKKADLHSKAGHLFEALMRWKEAAECYEQASDFDKAGALYSKAGSLKDAARCKESSGDLVSAAVAYERMKNWDKAAQIYQELKQTAKAAACFEQSGNWSSALIEWSRLSRFADAGRCLEQMGQVSDAAENYAHAGACAEAAHCYEKAEMWEEAADQYLKAKNLAGAGSALSRLGRRLDAAKLYLLAGQASVAVEICTSKKGKSVTQDPDLTQDLIAWAENSQKAEHAGALYEALGRFPEAAEKYKQSMMLSKAAQCAMKNGKQEEAAQLYIQDGNFELAADCFLKGKNLHRAAQCYELLKKWDEAKRIYEQLQDSDGVRRCEASSNWL